MLYTIWGEYFKSGEVEWSALREDVDWARRFAPLVEDLIAQGRLRTHRVVVKGGGLEGVIKGLEDLKEGLVSGGKLVYRVADTP